MRVKRDEDADSRPEAPASAEEALAAAWSHARRSLAEALRAARCLLDAAALAAGSGPGESRLAGLLDAAAEAVERGDGGGHARVLESVAEALDAEITRWERRAEQDPEARAVLRAFLGLRELLWEFGVRPRRRAARRRGHTPSRGEAGGGVQRVPVEG